MNAENVASLLYETRCFHSFAELVCLLDDLKNRFDFRVRVGPNRSAKGYNCSVIKNVRSPLKKMDEKWYYHWLKLVCCQNSCLYEPCDMYIKVKYNWELDALVLAEVQLTHRPQSSTKIKVTLPVSVHLSQVEIPSDVNDLESPASTLYLTNDLDLYSVV